MAFGVNSTGFRKPTAAEIEAILVTAFEAEFGSDITLAPETLLGQELALLKKREQEFWDVLEQQYYEMFFGTATGINLDNVAFPFSRLGATFASVILTFTGDDGTVIPAGTLAETTAGIQFATTEEVEIEDSSGGTSTVQANAVAVVAGTSGNQAVGAITELPVTISGVDSVTNATPATGGAAIESDADFIARVKVESQESQSSSVGAIRAAVIALDGVLQVTVNENATDDVVDGIPAHSIQVVVNGTATNQAIATAIYNSKAAGIGTFGSETYQITEEGQTYDISFDFASLVNIYVDVNLTINSEWVSANADLVKARVLEYIGGVDGNGVEYSGVQAGEDVFIWKVTAALFNLENRDNLGIEDVYIEMSRFDDPSSGESSNINILPGEEAITDLTFITVNTTSI